MHKKTKYNMQETFKNKKKLTILEFPTTIVNNIINRLMLDFY